MNMWSTRSGFRGTALLATLLALCAMSTHVFAQSAGVGRDLRVLLVLRASEQPNHVYVAGMKNKAISVGRIFGEPSHGHSRTSLMYSRVTYLNESFIAATAGFDRDTPMADAVRQAFGERSRYIEITATSDSKKYLSGSLTVKMADAARSEGYDYLIAIHDDFVGLATLNWLDAEEGLLTPAYDISYSVHDVVNAEIVARGKASSSGYLRQPAQVAAGNPALFAHLWPYLCTLNATSMVDDLTRNDHLHVMMSRAGRGADQPPVAARLADFERRLIVNLKPARGWHERRTGKLSRVLEPRDASVADVMRLALNVEFLAAELGTQAASVSEYLPLYDRQRLRQAPRATPLERFDDVSAPGFEVYRYLGQAGEHNLVFLKHSDSYMNVFTLSISGDFAELYPRIRPKVEEMLADSRLGLRD